MEESRVSIRLTLLSLFVAFLGAVTSGCASRVVPPPPEPDPMDRDEYVIGPADTIKVEVWKNAELGATVPVRPDGKISVPLLDDVQAAGLTPLELKEVITEALREYVAEPDVTVIVSQVASAQVYLLGGVARQGSIHLTRNLRVLDAISEAGGFTQFADRGDVRVLRRTANGLVEHRFDYDAYLAGDAPESNFLLHAGDTIVVPD
jgi:polysaccharide export outer membrane protein